MYCTSYNINTFNVKTLFLPLYLNWGPTNSESSSFWLSIKLISDLCLTLSKLQGMNIAFDLDTSQWTWNASTCKWWDRFPVLLHSQTCLTNMPWEGCSRSTDCQNQYTVKPHYLKIIKFEKQTEGITVEVK